MRRGDIHLADLDPSRGWEANRRPVVIVSTNGANAAAEGLGRGVVTVVPVTSNITRVFPVQTLLPAAETGLNRDSKAQAEQVRSIDSARLVGHIGRLTPELMLKLDEALPLHLSL